MERGSGSLEGKAEADQDCPSANLARKFSIATWSDLTRPKQVFRACLMVSFGIQAMLNSKEPYEQ